MADPGAPRLGANVYSFNVGMKLERPTQIRDESALLDKVSSGALESTLPVGGFGDSGGSLYSSSGGGGGAGTAASTAGGTPGEPKPLPKAMHNKYYKSRSGFGDTPHEVSQSIQESLCRLDDNFSRNSHQTVHTGQYYRLKPQHDAEQRQLYRQAKLEATLAAEREKDRQSRQVMRDTVARRQQHEREVESLAQMPDPNSQPAASAVSRDPEVLAMLADLRKDESARRKELLKEKSAMKSLAKGNIKGLAARKKRLRMQLKAKQAARNQPRVRTSPINRVDNAARAMLSPESGGSDGFVLVTHRPSPGGTSRRTTPKLVPAKKSSRRSSGRLATGRSPSVRSTARGRQGGGGAGGGGAGGSSGRLSVDGALVATMKPIGSGAAAVLDLSSITEGLDRGGSTYENEFGEEALKAIEAELQVTYKKSPASPLNNWLPKTEQTIINEAISLARKIQRQIAGLET
jgi:hypothetical protein